MTWDLLEAAWMDAYRELRAFNDQHGHFEVPVTYRTADGINLGEWQGTQRDADRAGKLTSQRRALLDAIGFCWNPAQARWTAPLPPAHRGHHPARRPRQPARRLPRGDLAGRPAPRLPPRQAPRAARSPSWNRRASRSAAPMPWMAAYQALAAFKAAHGHLRIPAGYTGEAGIRPVRLAARPARPAQSRADDHRAGTPADRGRILLGPRHRSLERPLPASSRLETGTRQPRPPPQAPPQGMAVPAAKAPRHGRLPDDRAALLRKLDALADPPAGTGKPQ